MTPSPVRSISAHAQPVSAQHLLVAMDLHDLIIQRVFAAGLSLEALRRNLPPGVAADGFDAAIADLDGTIDELRAAIACLRHDPQRSVSLLTQIHTVVTSASHALGFQPQLRLDRMDDVSLPGSLEHDIVAVLSEALSNVARHSGAKSVIVRVAIGADNVLVRVTDDGDGVGDTQRRSGVTNLAVRAQRHGGTCHLASGRGAGTSITWTVPLRPAPTPVGARAVR